MKIKIVSEAGGIVTRAKDKNLLVIYRKKYDDFTLPKGHVEKKDASWEAAALREVKEETGYRAKIISVADVIGYEIKNEFKIVLYFIMQVRGEAKSLSAEDKNDVTIHWLSVTQAIKRLSFPQQKQLLKRIFSKP